jgi:hypothetical protein
MYLFWFIPLFLVIVVGLWIFYERIARAGGGGRRDGKTLVDKEGEEPPRLS